MSRSGVTYIDVTKAAGAIKRCGQEPTVDRVREHLGTGSKSTISPLLKRWRSDNARTLDENELPNDLVEAVKSLHERMEKIADHKIEQAQAEFESRAEVLCQELEEAHNTAAQLNIRQKDLERQLQASKEKEQSLIMSLEEMTLAAAKSGFQKDEMLLRVAELKVSIEGRQQECDQFRSTNHQQQIQIQRLTIELSKAEELISEQINELAHSQEIIDKKASKNYLLQEQLTSKQMGLEALDIKYQAAIEKNQELSNKTETQEEKVLSLASLCSSKEKENELLKNSMEKAETELRETKDRMSLLADENKIILQEKAVIQGRFKQLESVMR